jgi:DMSO reductase family type II enzyme heme b subunit
MRHLTRAVSATLLCMVVACASLDVADPLSLGPEVPAPLPERFEAFGKTYQADQTQNPLTAALVRDGLGAVDADKYWGIVTSGKAIYGQNCVQCHGDKLDGNGHLSQGYTPRPSDLRMENNKRSQAELFWRITAGGPGLPLASAPWHSAMPAFDELLSETELWQVVTYLSDRPLGDGKLHGMALYQSRCAVCHGADGAGDGPAAARLYPKPRDFTLGLFKYKTSPPETLPTDDDLIRTIQDGLPGTAMAGWKDTFSDAQIRSLVPVIKRFDYTAVWAPADAPDEDFNDDGLYIGDALISETRMEPLTGRIPFSQKSAAKGRPVFEEVCGKCHGEDGRGNITAGKRLEDDWGERIWPRDLTKPWTWRATNVSDADTMGDTAAARNATISNIYKRLSVGIPGTPMPTHRGIDGNPDPISTADRWHVANFVYTLRETDIPPVVAHQPAIIKALSMAGNLPSLVDDPEWQMAQPVTLHLMPNLGADERLFTPLIDALTVRGLYNASDLVLLVEINDRTDSRPGEKISTHLHDERRTMVSDALALQFPKTDIFGLGSMAEQTSFAHGQANRPTTIIYWNAGAVLPEVRAQVKGLNGVGLSQVPESGTAMASISATWESGRWQFIVRLPLDDNGQPALSPGTDIPISFAYWDGNNGEEDGRHTLTSWHRLRLQ